MGYYGGIGARKIATVDALGVAAADAARLPDRRRHRPGRLRQLGGLGILGGARRRGLRHLLRQAGARGRHRRRAATSSSSCATTPAHVRHAVPDLRHDLAGLQPLRRQQPLRRRPGHRSGPRLQGQLQPAVHHARHRRPEDWLFNAEYPMVRWLEATATTSATSTGVDTDRRRARSCSSHKVFLSVGHDEYWSAGQRANVEAARDAGVNLAFFSGNEIFWKTRWENSIDGSATPYRTLVSYKETHANAKHRPADPPTWTGTWRDPRFSPPADGGRPENALTGHAVHGQRPANIVDHGPCGLRQAAVLAQHRGRELAAGRDGHPPARARSATSGTTTPTTASRPPGLIRLSSTTINAPASAARLRLDLRRGTATHSLTLYRAAERRAGLRRRHGPVVVGARRQPRPRPALAADVAHAAGDGQPVRRHGRAAGDACSRAWCRPRRPTDTVAPTSTITSPGRRAPACTAGTPVTITGTATRHRRRHRRRRRGVDRRRHDVAAGDRDAPLELHLDARRAPGSVDDQEPGRRRQRQSRERRRRRHGDRRHRATARAHLEPIDRPRPPPQTTDTAAVELGVKFRADVNGYITGIRFYKGSTNTGTHVGSLWTQHRHAARHRDVHQRNGVRLAAGELRDPGRDHGEHHLRRLVPRAVGPLRRGPTATSPRPASTTRRCMRSRRRPTAATASTSTARERASRRTPSRPRTTGSTSSSAERATPPPDTTPPTVTVVHPG